ncbi:MAG: hypothetical protein IIZ67_01210 [Bacilli bacterium]|nr:hypothetical protein [Bacilli bacterium]
MKKLKFKRSIDCIVKLLCCLFFFIFLGVETKTFIGTILLKGISIILFYINAIMIDKYGLI